ncbi:MAG: pyruvate kinase [Chlamydiota bacterium]|nr:pyruvate kinase [Chlamydiota bacterium]
MMRPKAMFNKKTKIVCTLGPACDDYQTILRMARAGMDVVRINCSHGNYDQYGRLINFVRKAEKSIGRPIGILMDLQGPKIRIGVLKTPIKLQVGQTIALRYTRADKQDGILPVDHRGLSKMLKKGDSVLLKDGTIALRVVGFRNKDVICKVMNHGTVESSLGLNLPGVNIPLPTLTQKDKADLRFSLGVGVDFIALSFVRSERDIASLHKLLGKRKKDVLVLAKIERPEALDRLDKILRISDGAIVARGDLGLEMAIEKIPAVQKDLIARCMDLSVPVITATQMLGSMVARNRPTRAEVMDVANAVLDGTDAVMLSEETAIGMYPEQSVRTMSRIIQTIEKYHHKCDAHSVDEQEVIQYSMNPSASSIAAASGFVADLLGIQWIVAFTMSGSTALRISKKRPHAAILALTPKECIARRMSLFWGVRSNCVPTVHSTDHMFQLVARTLRSMRLFKSNQSVVIVAGLPLEKSGITNLLKIHHVD